MSTDTIVAVVAILNIVPNVRNTVSGEVIVVALGGAVNSLVIAAGRGLGSRAGADEAAALAEQLGAAFGVSRPVVMNAWRPMEELLGVSGSMIHPKFCIVLGASGSPAFCAGISGSGTIIAVNRDPDAPIMKKSDICICGDWKDFLRAMVKYCNS